MEPSSAGPAPDQGSSLRRYGPVIAIVLVIAVVTRGKDNSASGTTGGTSAHNGSTAAPEGAVTFNDAKAKGITNLTFSDTCDQSTGRLAMPYFFRPECYANQPASGEDVPGV